MRFCSHLGRVGRKTRGDGEYLSNAQRAQTRKSQVCAMQKILTRDRDSYRDLIHLAIPVALQNLITFLVALADNLMVSKLGDFAVSGVYTGSQIQTLLQSRCV